MTTSSLNRSVEEQLAYLKKGAAEIIPEDELKQKLANSVKTGKPLRVYLGVDPTAPDIHLGHTVVLRKLKHFQDMGHTAIFLIGDFSAMIGDPTGQSETRPPLTREQVDAHAKTYLGQVYKILDREKTEVRYNSEWLGKLSSYEVVRLCAHYSLARMLEREDFRSRLANNLPIAVHELLYPLLTAYDAVMLKSDVELGATEQKFNILVHREIQRDYGLSPQVVFTMPILVGLDGERKMSKSLGNYVGITEQPNEMLGKLVSVSDETMWTYIELLTDKSVAALQDNVRRGTQHPFDVKIDMATDIVRDFHGAMAALEAAQEFRRVFRERQAPGEMREIVLKRMPMGFSIRSKTGSTSGSHMVTDLPKGPEKWSKLLAYLGETPSASEAERLMKQGGFELGGAAVRDPTCKINLNEPGSYEVRVGKKKFVRIVVE